MHQHCMQNSLMAKYKTQDFPHVIFSCWTNGLSGEFMQLISCINMVVYADKSQASFALSFGEGSEML